MIALALLIAGVAGPQGGSETYSRKDAELTMAAFAACEVKSAKGRDAALAFTREVEGTPSTYPRRLIASPCAPRGTQMRFKPELFRVALFPALYARDYGRATSVPDFASLPASDLRAEFDGTPSAETVALRNFGDCVVRRDPAGSRALVLSKLYSPEEAAAVAQLQPAMGQCIGEGQQLHFSRSIVHGAVGESLYKLTAAAAATKGS